MSELDVKIINLPELHVASALGFGSGPETQAWEKMFKFLQDRGLWEKMENMDFYGFNNPDPMPGSSNYGYEQWVVVDESIEPTDDVEIKTFPGGLFAVTRCTGIMNIYPTWQALAAWREDSPYQHAGHQWLEKWVNPSQEGVSEEGAMMDLYLPIIE
jgi:DNA gyrase inhibitor GyrI